MRSAFGSVLRESSSGRAEIVALRYAAGTLLHEHRHDDPYVSVLVHGRYTEIHEARPHRCESGTVIAHTTCERHADYFLADAVCVNVYPARDASPCGQAIAVAIATRQPSSWAEAFTLIEDVMRRDLRTIAPRSGPPSPMWLQLLLRDFDWTGTTALREAADRAGIHPAHLSRAFRKHVGLTPAAYRRRARIVRASAMLLQTSASLAQIADESGFYDQSDLTNRFSDASGLSPGRYREIFRS